MTEEIFIGIALAPAGHIAHAVSLDDLGHVLDQITFAWTPEKFSQALQRLSKGPADIFVGLELDELEPKIEKTLHQLALSTKFIAPWCVDNLIKLLACRKRILAKRAHLVAQILWLTEYQPTQLMIEG